MVDLDQQIRKLKRPHITDNGRTCIMNNYYVMKYICLGFVVQSKPHNEMQMVQGHFTTQQPTSGEESCRILGWHPTKPDIDIFYFF